MCLHQKWCIFRFIKLAAKGKGVRVGVQEGVAVAVQAKVVRVGEPMKGKWPIGDNKTPRFQKEELLFKRGGRLRHSGARRTAKKVTRLVRIVERRGGEGDKAEMLKN